MRPLLQLVAQKLALAHPGYETGLTSDRHHRHAIGDHPDGAPRCARQRARPQAAADHRLRGRRRCAACSAPRLTNPSWLLGVQLLDGVGAGMYEALLPLVLADLMRGTGRYSLARGVLGTIQGIGGSTGQGAAGFIVASMGYSAGFLALSAVAFAGLLLIVFAMPETRPGPRKCNPPDEAGA